jgi:glycosyltransferase involved in cell wall biosynthesis
MKIVQIISSLGNGGAEKFVVELSNELFRRNNEISIISFKKTTTDMIFVKKINPKINVIELNKKKGVSLKLFFQLFNYILKNKPDQIHFHLDSTFLYLFPLTIFFRRKKFTYTIHSKLSKNNKKKFEIINRLFYSKKNIDYVCISDSICKDFSNHFPKLSFKTVENGVNNLYQSKNFEVNKEMVESLKKNESTKICIVVGKVVPVKNYSLLLKSFAELKNDDIICIVIGNKSTEYYKKIKNSNIGNVNFIGLQSEIADFLILSDLFLMTSLNEGLPISALEAMYYGKPIITTPAGGMVDLIKNNINGHISKTFEVDEYVNLIKKYLTFDDSKLDKIKENNREEFRQRYTMEICCNNYLEIFQKK